MSIPHHSTHAAALTKLLTSGVTRSEAALALGITPSAVTQLAETPQVASALEEAQARIDQRATLIDEKYDTLEEKLLNQLDRTLPLLLRPLEISKVLQAVNGAKRRGSGHRAQDSGPTRILSLNIPVALQAKFVMNSSNQVVEAGTQTLVTMPSANIPKMAEVTNAQLQLANKTKDALDEFGLD